MNIPLWMFLIVLVWAIAVTFFCFGKNPLPFPDRGHRCFSVSSDLAARTVVTILDQLAGLKERFTFEPGPTRQTLLWDNTTVIMQHDEVTRKQGMALNGFSVVVSDPLESSQNAAGMLLENGFTANIRDDFMPGLEEKLVLLESNAFDGWVLVFRRHILAMGKPPNQHKRFS